MDEIVRAAMARWPDVPDVYGWLRLDERGRFRVRNADAERGTRFDPIGNTALLRFIGRNYQSDARGCWYFQNGPQRVFVQLALTPWVFRLDGAGAPVTHTGCAASRADTLLLDEHAGAILVTELGPGLVDDRDLGVVLDRLTDAAGHAVTDAQIESWLAAPVVDQLRFRFRDECIAVGPAVRAQLPWRLGFEPNPQAPA